MINFLKRLTNRWAFALTVVSLFTGRSLYAAEYQLQVALATYDPPTSVCVVSERVTGDEPFLRDFLAQANPPTPSTAPASHAKTPGIVHTYNTYANALQCLPADACRPDPLSLGEIPKADIWHVVCSAPSASTGRALFVAVRTAASIAAIPTLDSKNTAVEVKLHTTSNQPVDVSVGVLGGDYRHLLETPAVRTGNDYQATLPLSPVCRTHTIDVPSSLSPNAELSLSFANKGPSQPCKLPPDAKLVVPDRGKASITLGPQPIGPPLATLNAQWDTADTTIRFGYSHVIWSLKQHALSSGSHRCPSVDTSDGTHCHALSEVADTRTGQCQYVCREEGHTFLLPLDLTFSSPEGALPHQRWTSKLKVAGAVIDDFVQSEDRKLHLLYREWTKLHPPNLAQTIELTLPNGQRIGVMPLAGEATVDAKDLEIGQYVRIDVQGQRGFYEEQLQVTGSSLVLPTPHQLAQKWSASLLAAPLVELNGGIGDLATFSYAGFTDLDISYRGADWTHALDGHLSYALIGNRPYVAIPAPKARVSSESAPYNRLALQFGFTRYLSQYVALGATGGIGGSWSVESGGSAVLGGFQLSGVLGTFFRVKLVGVMSTEIGLNIVAPEHFSRFSYLQPNSDAIPQSIWTVGWNLYAGFRFGNHVK